MFIREILFLVLLSQSVFAQQTPIQWASKVLGVSSERSDDNAADAYKAKQVLGKPTKLPSVGESKGAWSPAGVDTPNEEWVKVGFERPQTIKQVIIGENIGAGSIIRVLAYDKADKETILPEKEGVTALDKGRLFHVVAETAYEVVAIKVVLNPSKVAGWNQIDAIGISSSIEPQEVGVFQAPDIPKEVEKENLGKNINSSFDELVPIISPDGKTLYFTRDNHPKNTGKNRRQDVWFSRIQADDTWGLAENIGTPINNDDHNAVISIAVDGKTLFLINHYLPDGESEKGLSKTSLTRETWLFPKAIDIPDFSTTSETIEFFVAPNGKSILFSAQRHKGKGGKDLYVSLLKPDQTWASPMSLGEQINTVENESSPFMASDNKTLYFTSDGLPGYGKGDIFVSRRLDSTWTQWSEPQNLGPLINTPARDNYLTIPASGDYGYLSSGENSVGGSDIFRFKLFPSIRPEPVAIVSGMVLNGVDKKPITADILAQVLNDSTSKEKITAEINPETNEYRIILPVKKLYSLEAKKKGFLAVSDKIDLLKDKSYREIRRNLILFPVKEGQKITLNQLSFEQSRFDILSSSYPQLEQILGLMKEYPTMEIHLEGHTDNQGDFLLNVKLSQDRVEAVKKFLVEKGIKAERISVKAWGSSKPIASNVTEDTRKKNRRVEFTITKI